MRGDVRSLNIGEAGAINAIISRVPADLYAPVGGAVSSAKVVEVNDDGSILEFVYPGYDRPSQRQRVVSPNSFVKDEDGVDVELLLYVDENKRLIEFEMVKIGDSDVLNPQWDTLTFVE